MKNHDVIAIGDVAVDAFIELEDARVACDINDENCTITMRFADKIPYKSLTEISGVGNSPNAAVASARMGLSTGLITNLGNDSHGKQCLQVFEKESIDTSSIRTHDQTPTNYHFVLQYGAERTILVKHEAYSYVFPVDLPAPKWIYLSSLGSNTESYHDAIADYLEKNTETKLAFQPGSFQMKLGAKRLEKIYARTEIFFSNKEEARRILEKPTAEFEELLRGIHALGPKMVVITDGPKGLTFFDGTHGYQLPMYPDPKPPVERTGAGDATSSTIMAYLALGMEPLDAFMRGPINSMSVVQDIGAQRGLLSREALEQIVANKPEQYRVQNIF